MCLSEVPELMHIAQNEGVFMILLFLLQKVTSPQAQEQGTNAILLLNAVCYFKQRAMPSRSPFNCLLGLSLNLCPASL